MRSRMVAIWTAAVVAAGWMAVSPPVHAQARPSRDQVLTEAFREVGRLSSPSVVRIHSNGKPIGYGAVIEEGWAVTVERIVRGAEAVRIETAEGGVGRARIVGREGWLDVALLRFDPAALEVPPIRRGEAVETGQWVISSGIEDLPLAAGVVSAAPRVVDRNRKSPGIALPFISPGFRTPMREYDGVIQHDSPIEEGELGTPLVDTEGRMVGLNVARPHRGTTFATPMADIEAALPALKEGLVRKPPADLEAFPDFVSPFGDLRELLEAESFDELMEGLKHLFGSDEALRGQVEELRKLFGGDELQRGLNELLEEALGKDLSEILEELRRSLGVPERRERPPVVPLPVEPGYLGIRAAPEPSPRGGVVIEKVYTGTPASAAGLQAGDVIRAVDGESVRTEWELKDVVPAKGAGSDVEITYLRQDPDTGAWEDRTARVTLGSRR